MTWRRDPQGPHRPKNFLQHVRRTPPSADGGPGTRGATAGNPARTDACTDSIAHRLLAELTVMIDWPKARGSCASRCERTAAMARSVVLTRAESRSSYYGFQFQENIASSRPLNWKKCRTQKQFVEAAAKSTQLQYINALRIAKRSSFREGPEGQAERLAILQTSP